MLTVAEVMETVRAAGEDGFLSPSVLPAPRLVDKVLVLLEQAAVDGHGPHPRVEHGHQVQHTPA